MFPQMRNRMFEQELAHMRGKNLLRSLTRIDSACGPHVTIGGRTFLALCSNDYLGLAAHPALAEAAKKALDRFGFGSGASRLVSGNSMLHEELEHRIAQFKGTEAALVFNSGYAANTGVIPALAQEGDALFSDSLNHASIIDGCRLSRASTHIYRHKDRDHLESLLRGAGTAKRKLIVTDGVFSMDGDIAPLPDLAALAEQYGAVLMVDDAHGTGVLGAHGRGTAEHFGMEDKVSVRMGTLGKALGSFGAYVAGDGSLITYLLNNTRSFIFSTALPPAVCAASIAALETVEKEPWRREALWTNRNLLAKGLEKMGIDTGESETPILPIVVGNAEKALGVAMKLRDEGILAPAIRPPSVPEKSCRIRTTITAANSEADIERVLASLNRLKNEGFV